MKTRAARRGPDFARAVLITTLAAVIGPGCAGRRPDPAAEQSITRAIGSGAAIEFRTEGGPLDEPDAAPDRLALADAVRRAVATDPGLQAALARVRVAMADADQARLLPNPILSLVLKFPEGGGGAQVEASLTAEIIRMLQAPRRARAADNRMRAAAADAVTVALDLVLEVQERYTAAGSFDELLPVLEERIALLDRLIRIARARLAPGEGTRADVTILEAQRVELEVEIADARLQQREERLRLARLVGEPSGQASWMLEPRAPSDTLSAPENQWIQIALAHRPEVQSVAWELAALGDDLTLVRLIPWEPAAAGVEAERDGAWAVGPSVEVPIPLFDTGATQRARVTAEQAEARHELTRARRTVVEDVRVAYQSLEANRANLRRIRAELIPLQQQRRQQAESAYLAGLTDATDLFLAEQNLRAAQARAVAVERQTGISFVRLQRAAGGPGIASSVGSPESAPPPVGLRPDAPPSVTTTVLVRPQEFQK